MPIVAGMGGNAGTQVLTLMIRGLALGQIGSSNARTLLCKEVRVAMMNGLSLGALLGVIVWIWYRDQPLSLVIGSALPITFCSAALGDWMVQPTVKGWGLDRTSGE